MTHSSPSSDPSDSSGVVPASPATPSTYPGPPRWLIVSGIVALVVVVLFLGVHLAGGGMGPMNHLAPAGGR